MPLVPACHRTMLGFQLTDMQGVIIIYVGRGRGRKWGSSPENGLHGSLEEQAAAP